jgi:crossover junction endodeoxyribonuclease RusA
MVRKGNKMSHFISYVTGTPRPQGSKKAFVIRGKAILVDASEGNYEWRRIVTQELANDPDLVRYKGAVNVSLAFFMEKAKSNKTNLMTQKPDIDKLARSVLDAMTNAELIEDDSKVVYLNITKTWATEQSPGVLIHVWQKPDA